MIMLVVEEITGDQEEIMNHQPNLIKDMVEEEAVEEVEEEVAEMVVVAEIASNVISQVTLLENAQMPIKMVEIQEEVEASAVEEIVHPRPALIAKEKAISPKSVLNLGKKEKEEEVVVEIDLLKYATIAKVKDTLLMIAANLGSPETETETMMVEAATRDNEEMTTEAQAGTQTSQMLMRLKPGAQQVITKSTKVVIMQAGVLKEAHRIMLKQAGVKTHSQRSLPKKKEVGAQLVVVTKNQLLKKADGVLISKKAKEMKEVAGATTERNEVKFNN